MDTIEPRSIVGLFPCCVQLIDRRPNQSVNLLKAKHPKATYVAVKQWAKCHKLNIA